MGKEHAALGLYERSEKNSKVYYVGRKNFPFSYYPKDTDGKLRIKVNRVTGQPVTNERGEPEYIHETVMFRQWQPRFHELGYWSIYEATKGTPKDLADALEEAAKNKTSEVMDEKAFINFSNPGLAAHLDKTEKLEAERSKLAGEVADAKIEKGKLEREIAKLKEKAGIK